MAEGHPELSQSIKQTGDRLIASMRAASRLKLERLLGTEPAVRDEDIDDEFPPLVPGHHLAMGLLVGPEVRIVAKIFYDSKQLKGMTGELLKSEKFAGVPAHFAREYLRQLGFLWAAFYQSHGIALNAAEPVVMRGFNEVFYPQAHYPRIGESRWRLARGNFFLWCTVGIEVVDARVLKKLRHFSDDFSSLEPLAQAIYDIPKLVQGDQSHV